MNELKTYVDELFCHQHLTPELKELKEEILSNMIARQKDLVAQGMSETEAIQRAKDGLVSIDGLVEHHQLAYIDRYRVECLQTVLLSCIIFWICSMPLIFTGYGKFSDVGLLATALAGVSYLFQKKNQTDRVAYMSMEACHRNAKIVWAVWSLFFVVYCGSMAALMFASNVWFGRQVRVDGPYEAAIMASRFYLPLLTISIPMTVQRFAVILAKNEKRNQDE